MTFLQPILLWGLAAAALPVLIHLLNRLRYRSVRWAAMMFLIRATRSSTRNARLRHYLILACRTLAVLAFALMLTRPLAGGWVGASLAGAPETVIVLLDRSASMEANDPRFQQTKRERAIALFGGVARETIRSSRFVLIDSVTRTPQEIAGPAALPGLSLAGPSDTVADFVALFKAAAEYMTRNRTGRTEIWVATDLQESNWRPESREWTGIAARIAALPQDVRVRVLALSDPLRGNRTLRLRDVRRMTAGGRPRIEVTVELSQGPGLSGPVPVTWTVQGTRSPADVKMTSSRVTLTHRIEPTGDGAAAGWGRVDLPADENGRDNSAFFAWGAERPLKALVVASDHEAGRILRLAAAPGPAPGRQAEETGPGGITATALREAALVLWQGAPPQGDAMAALHDFTEAGGCVAYFPPSGADAPAASNAAASALAWGAPETAAAGTPFRVSLWEELEGPLAKTSDGRSLPVARLEVSRRRIPSSAGEGPAAWHAVASFVDGKAMLARQIRGRGEAFACATLPVDEWSTLGEGRVLVPMVQRWMERGGRRLGDATTEVCGEWSPQAESDVWTPVEGGGGHSWREQAGVYASVGRLAALNRPAVEDDEGVVAPPRLKAMFGSVPVSIAGDLAANPSARLQSELWPALLLLCLLFLLAESVLLLFEHVSARARGAAQVPS